MLRHIPLSICVTVLLVTLSLTAISSVTVGPMNISGADTLRSLLRLGDLAPHIDVVIQEIRLPRTLLCMLVGAILALCGVVMQGLFRNPLAETGHHWRLSWCGIRWSSCDCRPFSSGNVV